jgi:alpha/beta superfamily hydrolase
VLPPTRIILAGNDEYGNLAELRERVELPAHVECEEIPGVDHFFRGKTPELDARVLASAREQIATVA